MVLYIYILKFFFMSFIALLKGMYMIIFNKVEISAISFMIAPSRDELDNCAYIDKLNSRYMDLLQYGQQKPIDEEGNDDESN